MKALLLAALLGFVAPLADAAQRALLVGVSELVNQPSVLWLQAPRNDVLLMRQALLKQGFAPEHITVLADGVSGAALPEAQRIHEALAQLLAQSASGDFVMLYFSGHGTRLRDAGKRYQEPDGLAENFLARDVRGAIGAGGAGGSALSGGLRDVDFDAWVQAFLAKNVFVWSVFDTCSATSMTRGRSAAPSVAEGPADDEVRWRGLRAGQLQGRPEPPSATIAPPAAARTARARYVAFFASESHQVTPELRLPRQRRGAQPQGLLTWAVAEALARKPATWRALFDGVLAQYPPVIEELAQRFPTRELPSPVAEGSLDAPLFANSAQPASTLPAWRAQRAGDALSLSAGLLDGLVPQQELRVSATLEDGTVRSDAARIEQLGPDSARIAVPPALRALSGAALWSASPLAPPPALALRLRTGGKPLPAGLSVDYPASLLAVNDGDADLRWSDRGAAGHQLEGLSPAFAGMAQTLPADAAALRERLQGLAQLKWLMQLQALGKDGRLDGFDAVLEVWRGEALLRSQSAAGGAVLPPLRPGERAVLAVRNASGHSLDLLVVGIDGRGATQPVFPGDSGETNRFEQGTREQPAAKRFELPWLAQGGEARLLVLAAPAVPYSAPRLFGVSLAQGPMADLRVRGQVETARARPLFTALMRWGTE